MPEEYDNSFEYKIMKRDLDANHHVNNLSYLSIASEVVPNDVIDNATTLNIVFILLLIKQCILQVPLL